MIGLLTGFGTRAGTLVYNKFIDSCVAKTDSEWPEIMVLNVAPKFDAHATITPEIIDLLHSSVVKLAKAGCTNIFTVCNTVHACKDAWFIPQCVDWTDSFNKSIPPDYVRIGSKTSAESGLYNSINNTVITELINCYIGSKTPITTARAKAFWNDLIYMNKKVALCCTELSLSHDEFQIPFSDRAVIDCSDHIVEMMHQCH